MSVSSSDIRRALNAVRREKRAELGVTKPQLTPEERQSKAEAQERVRRRFDKIRQERFAATGDYNADD